MSLFKNASELQYGAQQVILVRDDSAKERLLTDRPSFRGKILTVREAKGLEFNDVLLLGFFTDSPLSVTDWRALGAYLKHLGTWENEGVPREAVSNNLLDFRQCSIDTKHICPSWHTACHTRGLLVGKSLSTYPGESGHVCTGARPPAAAE